MQVDARLPARSAAPCDVDAAVRCVAIAFAQDLSVSDFFRTRARSIPEAMRPSVR